MAQQSTSTASYAAIYAMDAGVPALKRAASHGVPGRGSFIGHNEMNMPTSSRTTAMLLDLSGGSHQASPPQLRTYGTGTEPFSMSSTPSSSTIPSLQGTPKLLMAPHSNYTALPLVYDEQPIIQTPSANLQYLSSDHTITPGPISFDFSSGALHLLAGWQSTDSPRPESLNDHSDSMDVDQKIRRTAKRGAPRGTVHSTRNTNQFPTARHEEWKRKREASMDQIPAGDHKRIRTA